MRYYGENYSNELSRSISAVRDSVEQRNYAFPINNAPVGNKYYMIKNQGENASRQAMMHVIQIKNKLDRLQKVLDTFYTEVDETGAEIIAMAGLIDELIQESTFSMHRMSCMLKGVGAYKGQTISPKCISSVGIDTDKFKKRTTDFWMMVLDVDLVGGNAREDVVEIYLEQFKSDKEVSLTPEDTKRMQGLLEHYQKLKFGETNDIRNMDLMPIDHCIKIYEYLYPENAKKLNTFFSKALKKKKNKTIQKNIKRIKYGAYTADPELRDILFEYLPKMKLYSFDSYGAGDYVAGDHAIHLNLAVSYDEKYDIAGVATDPFANFFHEVGHGIDELSSGTDEYITSGMNSILLKDMNNTFSNILDESEITLDKDQKKTVIDYIIGARNVNVLSEGEENLNGNLPQDWNDEMKESVECLRDYYGCMDYHFNDGRLTDASAHPCTSGLITKELDSKLVSDIVGGLTNNMLGGTPYLHPADFVLSGYSRARSEEELEKELISGSYWYTADSKINNKTEHEFFANYFEAKIGGYDLETSRITFPDSCETLDRILDHIHNEINK